MPRFTTSAVLVRRIAYGDYDLILTFFSIDRGKITLIAKSAKKSKKRFAGILEPFSELELVSTSGKGKGLSILQEAALLQPFSEIRKNIVKTAYASYWTELVNEWMEDGQPQKDLYSLLTEALHQLDASLLPEADISVLFQIRFIAMAGLLPNLADCSNCGAILDQIQQGRIHFDLAKGGLVCKKCCPHPDGRVLGLARGTIKNLVWMSRGNLENAKRVKLSAQAVCEGLELLEHFVPYHVGKNLKSLSFLQQIRK